jgi:hypothetical protein
MVHFVADLAGIQDTDLPLDALYRAYLPGVMDPARPGRHPITPPQPRREHPEEYDGSLGVLWSEHVCRSPIGRIPRRGLLTRSPDSSDCSTP